MAFKAGDHNGQGGADPQGTGSYTHLWRTKSSDLPCTPTGVEQSDENGRIYAQVRTPEGDENYVPKEEIVPRRT